MQDPILASRLIPSRTKAYRLSFKVVGGLHYMRGNRKPYFSLTYDSHRAGHPNQCQSGSAGHDEILKWFPRFADLAKLHLSDIDGVPMHAEENGWYNLAGSLPDNACERYHAGNSKRNVPKPEGAPRRGEWDTTDYREPTPDECLQFFADHVRVDLETARALRDQIVAEWERTRELNETPVQTEGDDASDCPDWQPLNWTKASWAIARSVFAEWIVVQEPRWKEEAQACIKRHGLKVYGDKWEQS
jgi:hypothetical protein